MKGQTFEGQFGVDNETNILDIPLPLGIVPETNTIDLHVTNIVDISEGHTDILIVEIDPVSTRGGNHFQPPTRDSLSVLVIDSYLQDDVMFVVEVEKCKGKVDTINQSEVCIT